MNELLIVTFPNEKQAEQGRGKLISMEKEKLIAIEDAVVALKEADGTVKLRQLVDASAFWEIRAAASGNLGPTNAGLLTDFGASDTFVKDAAEAIPPGSVAVFVLVGKTLDDSVIEGLRAAGGTAFRTPFVKSDVGTIRAALAAQTKPTTRRSP
jgi:uncharacterized membrane protein